MFNGQMPFPVAIHSYIPYIFSVNGFGKWTTLIMPSSYGQFFFLDGKLNASLAAYGRKRYYSRVSVGKKSTKWLYNQAN